MTGLPADLPGLARGGKAALARVLSALESAPDHPELATLMDAASAAPRGMVIGITRNPLVNQGDALVHLGEFADSGRGIALDPSS